MTREIPHLAAPDLDLFLAYARDAANWSGSPLVGGNVPSTRGNTARLTHLKRAGLLETERNGQQAWIVFTPLGQLLARQHGIELAPDAKHATTRVWTQLDLFDASKA